MILDGMLLRNITEKQVFFLTKLIATIIIFYIGANYAVLPVGEDYAGLIQKDYVGIDNVEILTGQWHFAALNNDSQYADKFTSLCSSNSDLCDAIVWVGKYTQKDKYVYLSNIVSIVNFVQDNKLVGNDIVPVIRMITVDTSAWDRRWYATWNEIVFNIWTVESRTEFGWLVSHELWHVYDLGALQWISASKHSAFTEFGRNVFATDDLSLQYYANSWKSETIRKSEASKKDFCSGYGMSDPFEDFAECFNLYINHNTLFKTMAKRNQILKKKYNFVASIFDWKFLHAYDNEASYTTDNINWRPWDTTRINQ